MSELDSNKRIKFNFRDALSLGFNYIKRRRSRAIINIASIGLGIAFLSNLMISDAIYQAYASGEGTQLSVGTYQYWLMVIALIVSGVGITNAMLVSVYERYREIGTMKCLGAMDIHVLSLFFIEACIQGFIGGITGFLGGIIGAILTTGLTVGFGRMLEVSPVKILYIFSFSIILSVVLSTVATIYPAHRASRLNPVRALSYEL